MFYYEEIELVNGFPDENAMINDIMQSQGIEILHLKSTDHGKRCSNGITVAYRRNTRGKSVEIATAVCSKHDQYNKRFGKQIAVDRFINGQTINVPFSYYADTRAFLTAMFAYAE